MCAIATSGTRAGRGAGHRVLLVREWDSQVGGSGCCGRLGGGSELGCTNEFAHAREGMVAMGAVYRALRQELPEADLTVVDRRNTVWLLPTLVRDARRRGLGWGAVVRQLTMATRDTAIVADGLVISSGEVPAVCEAVRRVHEALGTPAR